MIQVFGLEDEMRLSSRFTVLTLIIALSFRALGLQVSEDTAAHYSNPESLKDNVVNPILSDSDMVSANGSTFSAQASCRAENEYLRVYAVPKPSGDLDVSVIHDHDLDGTFAVPQSVQAVAGICLNGYAQNCNGDFSSCDFYEWSVDSSFNVSGVPSSISQGSGVEGCYCINNSCGAGLYFVNQERIHDDIGTGISLAFQRSNPSFGITNVQTVAGVTSFYGHDPDTCDGNETSQQVFYDNPSSIPTAAFSEAGNSTLFAKVSSAQSSGHTSTTQACFEEHGADILEPSLDDIIEITRLNGVVSVTPCGANCFNVFVGQPGNNNLVGGDCTQYNHRVEFDVKRPEDIVSITLIDAAHDDDLLITHTKDQVLSNIWFSNFWDTNNPPANCERARSDYTLINRDITSLFQDQAVFNMDFWAIVGRFGELYVHLRVILSPSCETTPTINNTCGSIPSDCYLDSEQIDGVSTVVNTVGTGLLPIPSARTFTGGSCSDTIMRPYWRIDRNYKCPANGSRYDFTDGLERARVVNTSTTTNGFNDLRQVDGSPIASSETLTLPLLPSVSDCQQSCKTRKTVDELGIATSGLSVGSRPDDSRFEYSYKSCNASTCPLDAGETIETPCGCLDRFSEAASAIQAFRLAGKDFVCTTEEP